MKRRLFKIVLFLLLGAIVNVVVAWGCAALIDWTGTEGETGSSPLSNNLEWVITRYDGPGMGWVMSSTDELIYEDFLALNTKDLAPSWANLNKAPSAGLTRGVHAYGWPAKSL